MNYGPVVQAILFAIFAALTAALSVVTGPMYDGLLVPELAPTSVYASWTGGSVLATGVSFSNILLVEIVDPCAVLVIVGVGLLYLVRAVMPSPRLTHLAPRLIVGLVVANFVIPLTSALWALASAVYPTFFNLGGGSWQSYSNLVGPGAISFSWDNGLLAFVVSLLLFTLVLMLAFLVAFRSALLAVLIVLLPPLTLLWSIPQAAPLARKAWTLFVEMTFLPGLLIVPLALAVGSPSILLTLGLFAVALAMPQLFSVAGHSASQLGLPNSGSSISSGMERGAASGQQTATGFLRSAGGGLADGWSSGRGGAATGGSAMARSGGSAASAGTVAGGGPAAWVAWGMNEGIGSLGRRLGQAAGEAAGPPSGPKSSAGHDLAERTTPPRPGPRELRAPGVDRPGPVPASTARAAPTARGSTG